MNEERFNRALNYVDIAYVAEYLEESGRAKKRRLLPKPWQKILAAAACLAILVGVCGATDVFHLRGNTPGEEPPQIPHYDYEQTPISSYPVNSSIASSEPEASFQRLSVDTYSFFKKDDIVTIDVGIGDIYTLNQEIGHGPGYDTYGENGYPFLLVYDMDWWNGDNPVYGNFNNLKDGSRLIVNGEAGRVYEKRFTKEDMADLDISKDPDIPWTEVPPEQYHRETVCLDFSQLQQPWHGCVHIVFGWYYEHGDPKHPDSNMEFKSCQLRYYVGEEGVGLSFVTDEYAVNAYKEGVRRAARNAQLPADVFVYGTFRDCKVWLVPGQLCVVTVNEVGGYAFIYGSSFTIWVEKGEETLDLNRGYDLSEAYEKGLLTGQDIAEIYRIHREHVGEALYRAYVDSLDPPVDVESLAPVFSSVGGLREAVTAAKAAGAADSPVGLSSLDRVYYPALELDGYRLYQIEVLQQRIIYYFVPADTRADDFMYENGITVTFRRTDGEQAGSDPDDLLAALAEQAGVPLTKDHFLYEKDKNTLTLSVGDTWMAIRVPDDLNDYDVIVGTFGLTEKERLVTVIDMVDCDGDDNGDAAHD